MLWMRERWCCCTSCCIFTQDAPALKALSPAPPPAQDGKARGKKVAGGSAKKAASRKAAKPAAKQEEAEEEEEVVSSEEEREQRPQARSRSGAARLAAEKAAAASKGELAWGGQVWVERWLVGVFCFAVTAPVPLLGGHWCCSQLHAMPASTAAPSRSRAHRALLPSHPLPTIRRPAWLCGCVRAARQPEPHACQARQSEQGRQGGRRGCCRRRRNAGAQVSWQAHAWRQQPAGGH